MTAFTRPSKKTIEVAALVPETSSLESLGGVLNRDLVVDLFDPS